MLPSMVKATATKTTKDVSAPMQVALVESKALDAFVGEDRFPSCYLVHVGAYALQVATNGHALAARVSGPGAGSMSAASLLELATAKGTQVHVGGEGEVPGYWLSMSLSRDERTGAREIGIDAELLAKVGLVQREHGRQLMLALSLARAELRSRVPVKLRRGSKELVALEAIVEERDKHEPWAATEWHISGPLDPVLWFVRGATASIQALLPDLAWVGAVMPRRL